MPREIVTLDGSSFHYHEYALPPPEGSEVRLRVEFAAPKHGTEAHAITGSVFGRKVRDSELRMFLPRPETEPPTPLQERRIGNIVVGTVTAVGPGVTRFAPGDR